MNEIPKEIIEEVEKQIKEEHKDIRKGLGYCHQFWARKKYLLKQKGYDWKTPAEKNPHITYD